MRLQNSPLYQNIKSSPIIKMFLVFFVVLIVLAIAASFMGGKNNSKKSTGEYYDAGSGETVSNPEGKAAENYGDNQQPAATLLGFSKLVGKGLTQGQLTEVSKQVQNFNASQNPKITELSLATNSIVFTTPAVGETTTTVTGELTANRKDKYTLELSYDRIVTIRTVIKKSGVVVYDSGVVNYYDIENTDE